MPSLVAFLTTKIGDCGLSNFNRFERHDFVLTEIQSADTAWIKQAKVENAKTAAENAKTVESAKCAHGHTSRCLLFMSSRLWTGAQAKVLTLQEYRILLPGMSGDPIFHVPCQKQDWKRHKAMCVAPEPATRISKKKS